MARWENNVWRHPIEAVRILVHRIRGWHRRRTEDLPPALKAFRVGERLVIKHIVFEVGYLEARGMVLTPVMWLSDLKRQQMKAAKRRAYVSEAERLRTARH